MEETKRNWMFLKAYGRTGQSFKRSSSPLLQKLVIYLFQGKLFKKYLKILCEAGCITSHILNLVDCTCFSKVDLPPSLLLTLHIPFPGHVCVAPVLPCVRLSIFWAKFFSFFPISSSPLLSFFSYDKLFNPIGFLEENVVGVLWLSSQGLVLPTQMSLCSPEPFCCFIWLSGWDSLT